MSVNERKYFRRFGLKDESKGESYTEVLFDLLCEFDVFDEEKIAIRLKRAKLDKQIAHLKKYLFDVVLETLLWYNKESNLELSAAVDLAKIKELEDRGLDEEALARTSRLSKHVAGQGSFVSKWNMLDRNIHYASNEFLADKKAAFTDVDTLLRNRETLIAEMHRYHEYDALLAAQLKLMRKTMQARTAENLEALQQIHNNPLIQKAESANSVDALFTYHTIRLHHFQIFGRWNEFYTEALALVAFIKQHLQQLATMRQLWAYAQLTQACYFTGQWKELEKYLNELESISTSTPTETAARFAYHAQLAITLYDFKQDKAALTNTLRQATKNLKEFKHTLRPDIRLAITVTCASAFVDYGYYDEAIDICEDFLTNYDSGIRLDALLMLYVYEFICHLELGNSVYVANTIQNTYRYFLRNKYNGEFENVLMKVFKKLAELGDQETDIVQLEKLKAELQQAALKNQSPTQALMPIVEGFINAKMEGLKMHEFAIRGKAQNPDGH